MYTGIFKWNIPSVGAKKEFGELDKNIRKALEQDEKFDSTIHSVYEFKVIPVIIRTDFLSWKDKKKDYARLDKVLVHAEAANNQISFCGIFPVTTKVSGQKDLPSMEGDLVLKFGGYGRVKLKVGKLGRFFARKGFSVFSTWQCSNPSPFAQWIFFRHWLETVPDFGLKVMCYLPKHMEEAQRYVKLSITGQDKGRAVEALSSRIFLPL